MHQAKINAFILLHYVVNWIADVIFHFQRSIFMSAIMMGPSERKRQLDKSIEIACLYASTSNVRVSKST